MNPKLVQEALGRRKAQALDITILLGTPDGDVQQVGSLGGDADQDADDVGDVADDDEDKTESKKLDMAPDAPQLGEEQDLKDRALGRIGHDENMMPGAEIMGKPEDRQALIQQELAKLQLGKNSLSARASKKY